MTDIHTGGDHIHIIRYLYAFDMPIQYVKFTLLKFLWQEIANRTKRHVLETLLYSKGVIRAIFNQMQLWSIQPNSHKQFTTTSRELVSGSRGLQRPVKVFGNKIQSIYSLEYSAQASSLEASWSIRDGDGAVWPTAPTCGGEHNLRRLAAHMLGTRSMSCIICIYCRRYPSISIKSEDSTTDSII